MRRIAKLATLETYPEGEVIVREGDHDGRLFVIVSGHAQIIRGLGSSAEWRLQTLGPRAYFGEMALIDDWTRTASVVAETEMQVLTLERWDLRGEIEKNPLIAIEFLQMLTRRVRLLEKKVVHILEAFLPLCDTCAEENRGSRTTTPLEEPLIDPSELPFHQKLCEECSRTLYERLYRRKGSIEEMKQD